MGFKMKIEGDPGSMEFGYEQISSVKYISDTPDDSNARSNDVSLAVVVTGKIIDNEGEPTVDLANWSIQPVEENKCYGKVTITYVHAAKVVREMVLPNAFIVSYKESFDNNEGVGTFEIFIRQKKDKNKAFECSGGFDSDGEEE